MPVNEDFFGLSEAHVVSEYCELMGHYLGETNPKYDHIVALHRLGYLPIEIYSIPEGFSTNLGVPSVVITNTLPEFYWLPNYFETLMSMCLWKPSTSATTAQRLRKICEKWAKASGEADMSFVDWQCHDFSERGMSGMEDAILSGMGHLLSFSGTDTIPAILAARKYYAADLSIGGSVNATEHSVMCAGGKEDEFETFRRLLCDVYPKGILSVVSDTWDLWKVLTDFVPRLKDQILAREGRLIIRPDSGDPVKILCGDHAYLTVKSDYPGFDQHPASLGVMRLLASELGRDYDRAGLPLIKGAGAIYGDSMNEERIDAILKYIVEELQLSPNNFVAGVGSFKYEHVTRDTYGFAMKATAVVRNGELVEIFKDPVTDDGGKRSLKGVPAVYRTEESTDQKPEYFVKSGSSLADLANCAYQKVFADGRVLVNERFADIRKRVRA